MMFKTKCYELTVSELEKSQFTPDREFKPILVRDYNYQTLSELPYRLINQLMPL
jgi:hypothetical protein